MKILVIGDPHGSTKYSESILKKVDLVLLTGDLGSANLMRKMAFENIERSKRGLPEKEYTPIQEKRAFMEAYNSSVKVVKYFSRFAPVYTIFGNVESSNYETRKQSRKIGVALLYLSNKLNSMKNVRIINNRIGNFNGLRIGGLGYFLDTCWVKEFKPFEYKKELEMAKKESDKAKRILRWFAKQEIDILLCHQPPYGFLDKVTFKGAPKHWKGKHAGSKIILSYIKKKHLRYVFCGHIHEGKGKKKIGKTTIVNAGFAGDYFLLDI